MKLLRIILSSLIFLFYSCISYSQSKSLYCSEWTNGAVSVKAECPDSIYSTTDTTKISLLVRNYSGRPIYLIRRFKNPIVEFNSKKNECEIDLSFESYFNSDPLMNGAGPSMDAVIDSARTIIDIPLNGNKLDSRRKEVIVSIYFSYVNNISGYEFMLDRDVALGKMGPKELVEFDSRCIRTILNPIRILVK